MMKGYHNISFVGLDRLIADAEYYGIKWTKRGLWVTLFGIDKETRDYIMTFSREYHTF